MLLLQLNLQIVEKIQLVRVVRKKKAELVQVNEDEELLLLLM